MREDLFTDSEINVYQNAVRETIELLFCDSQKYGINNHHAQVEFQVEFLYSNVPREVS